MEAITEGYDLELQRVIHEILEKNAKVVALQLPDGMKPQAKEIVDAIKIKTDALVLIWAGSCFGACDIPVELDRLGVDLLIHYGHTEWRWN